MKYRKLRITWSLFWGVACLLLIALWVRGYSWFDQLYFPIPGNQAVGLSLAPGTFGVVIAQDYEKGLARDSTPFEGWFTPGNYPHSRLWGFFYVERRAVVIPIWFLLGVAASLGTIPWLRQRPDQFSLRTLLIAMTLVAVGLGLVVYAMR